MNDHANLREPYNQDIKVQVATKYIKKGGKKAQCAKGVNFSNNISVPQFSITMRETEHDTTFENFF